MKLTLLYAGDVTLLQKRTSTKLGYAGHLWRKLKHLKMKKKSDRFQMRMQQLRIPEECQ
jgi:hypothetical protein